MKITVMGIGKVGSTVSFLLAREGLANELLLWNRTPAVAEAEAIDIQQACAFTPHRVRVRAAQSVEDTAGHERIDAQKTAARGRGFLRAEGA
ncbi:MAG: lactate/malate family dehydrogenase [Pseudomonadota bacterium]